MKQNSFKRWTSTLALSAIFATLCTPAEGLAVLDVPYGDDNAPPDSNTQAEVDALNEALEGPEEGQTWAAWEVEFEAAYEDLFGSTPEATPYGTSSSQTFVQISSTDLCRDPLNLWVPGASDENVADALAQPGVRSDLIRELEDYLYWILLMSGVGDLEFEPPNISGLKCNQCAMTYDECLALGNDWAFCKSRYLTCPKEPTSSLSVSLSVTSPVSGTITATASANSEISRFDGVEYPNFCFTLKDYEFDGFSFAIQALIQSQIDAGVLGDGHFCLYDR